MSILQLTDQKSPLAQTFRVTEPSGSVLTGVGIYFSKAPAASDPQIPIAIELRPVTASGVPSAKKFIPGSRVTATASAIRAVASTTFSSATEYKFEFREPIFIRANTEVAVVISTSAQSGQYKVWHGRQGEHVAGTNNTRLVTANLAAGVLFKSSNGTTWSKDQYADLAFKVYRAKFRTRKSTAYLVADAPGPKRLTENTNTNDLFNYVNDPLSFTAGNKNIRVIHPMHGHIVGDKVKLEFDSDGFDSGDTINGIPASEIIKTHTIDSADPYGYTVKVSTNATATLRAGGSHVLASEQYVMNEFAAVLPVKTPPNTSTFAGGDFTTFQSFAGSETAYATTGNVKVPFNQPVRLAAPHVITSSIQEGHRLSNDPSLVIRLDLNTDDKYVAPTLNINHANIKTHANVIDYQDSDNGTTSNRNKITTIDFNAESDPVGGTTVAKHITIPYTLEETATSIRVIVDATRPVGADFTVWFRTSQTADGDTLITETDWTAFSKTVNPPNTSNYTDLGNSTKFRQFEFNAYDIDDFDQYQIKITMNSTNTSAIPFFKNLRTIATV